MYAAVVTAAHVLAYVAIKDGMVKVDGYAYKVFKSLNSGWWLLLYIPLLNLLLLQLAGRYILLSFVIYPYQNSVMREQLDRSNNARFAEEFSYYLKSLIYTLRVHAGLVMNEYMESEQSERKTNSSNRKLLSVKKDLASISSMQIKQWELIPLGEMRNVFDLLETFYEANTVVL